MEVLQLTQIPEGKGVETTVELVPMLEGPTVVTGNRVALAVVVVVVSLVFIVEVLVGFLVELEAVQAIRVQGVAVVAVQCLSPTAHSI